MQGLMQDYPLTLPHFFHRAERLFPTKEVVTATPTGVERTSYGTWAERTRRLGGALDVLGVSGDGRVGSFAWNTARHLELYFAAPCSGRVLHTLNIRLFADQLTYIVNHAEDQVVLVDDSLVPVLEKLAPNFETVRQYVVVGDGDSGSLPNVIRYEELIADQPPGYDYPELDERTAAGLCYTSGTTGNPKGVLYSHRSNILHSMASCLADTVGVRWSDRLLPVVPMFHANAWGLPYACGLATLPQIAGSKTSGLVAALVAHEKTEVAAAVTAGRLTQAQADTPSVQPMPDTITVT